MPNDPKGADEDAVDGVRRELLEDEDTAAGEEGVVESEGGVFGGGGNEGD